MFHIFLTQQGHSVVEHAIFKMECVVFVHHASRSPCSLIYLFIYFISVNVDCVTHNHRSFFALFRAIHPAIPKFLN